MQKKEVLLNELEDQKGWEHAKKDFNYFIIRKSPVMREGNFNEDECQIARKKDG